MLSAAEALGDTGPLQSHIHGFRARAEQQAMAEAVESALAERGTLVTEAGTGTGKTFAYLVPVCLRGGRTLVSTGTRTLQEQLFRRDLPTVCDALGVRPVLAMLKGRSNYLCRYRLEIAQQSGQLPRVQQSQLHRISVWAGRTHSGDVEEVDDVPADAPVWYQVTSTAENCLGSECPDYQACHVVKARRAAQSADIVVINHHLLLSDMRLREEGFGELLPDCEAIVIDEAHQLPELASQYFGRTVSAHQMQSLARDAAQCQAAELGDAREIGENATRLIDAVDAIRTLFGRGETRGAWRTAAKLPGMEVAMAELNARIIDLYSALEIHGERSKGIELCRQRCAAIRDDLVRIIAGDDENLVSWYETSRHAFRLHQTAMSCAEGFRAQMERYDCAWIFTSATLSIGTDFSHFTSRLGIEDPRTGQWASPFDYANQALLFLPEGLPDPGDRGYTDRVVELAAEVITSSRGRAFVLFTSHHALRHAAERLRAMSLDYPLLVQGDGPRGLLLERFRSLGNAVLLGTSSFWEGVDVRGEHLSCVIIDKLPFFSPDDPVFQARQAQLARQGENAFRVLQLPQAVLALKQGSGRLIRDRDDFGVLVLCDPRLMSRGYGRVFLNNLPPMTRTRSIDDVKAFFSLTAETRETLVIGGTS